MAKSFNSSGFLLISIFLLLFYACSKQKDIENILDHAQNILEQHPDSALQLLNSVLFPENLSKSRFNKYNLLLLQAKDKSCQDITSDTVIFTVKDYYLKKEDYPNTALAAFYCGQVWHERNNIEEAVKSYSEAERLADKTENYNLKGLIQANWGILHWEHLSYEKAIELIKSAVEMYGKAKNYRNETGALRIIGDCFALNDRIDSAFYYYNMSLKLADLYNMPEIQSDIKQSMGVANREQGLYEPANKLFKEALALLNDSVEQARILLNIAQVYILEDNRDSVNFYLNEALALHIFDPELMRTVYLLKSEISEKNKHYQDALNNYKEFYDHTVKVFDSEQNNKLLEVQSKYDFEKLKNTKSQLIIKQQKTLNLLSLALLTAGIIAFLYYRKFSQNRRLLLETGQKLESLQRMADNFSIESHTVRNVLLDQFNILRKTALIKNTMNESEQISGQKLLNKFNEIVYGQEALDWSKLYYLIDNIKNGLYTKIHDKYPRLSDTEFRIICLSCETDFSDKEIMIILGIKLNMVRRIRSDLRKKIGMDKGEDFFDFFEKTIQ